MPDLPAELPDCGVGKLRTRKNIKGQPFTFFVEDFVGFPSKDGRKFICLQKIQHTAPRPAREYRFAYYMVGEKPGAKGRWVFGQFALLLGEAELKKLLKLATKKWSDFANKVLPN
jgi:hypothetical protein